MINYQPPAPVAPAVSAQYGAAEEYDKVAPTVLGYRQQQLQGQLAGAGAYQAGVNATTERTVAAGQQNTQLEALHQQQLFAANQEAMQRAQQQALQQSQQQHAAEMQARQADDQVRQMVAASQIQLSTEEQSYLQKVQRGDAYTDQQFAEGAIDQDTRDSWKAQSRGLKAPLEYRAAKADIMRQEQQTKTAQQQADLQHQTEVKRAELATQSVEKRTVAIVNKAVEARVRQEMGDPPPSGPLGGVALKAYEDEVRRRTLAQEDGVDHYNYTDLEGKTHIQKSERTKPGTEAAQLEMAKAHWAASEKKAQEALTLERKRAHNADPTGESDKVWADPAHQQEFLDNYLKRQTGATSQEQYLAGVLTGRARPPLLPGSRFAMSGVEGPQGPPQGGTAQGPPEQRGGPQPFNPREPLTQTDVQKFQTGLADRGAGAYWERPDLSQPQREQAVAYVNHVKRLVAETGGIEKMSADQKAFVFKALRYLESLPPPAAPAPQKRPAPAPPPPLQESYGGGFPSY